MFNEYVILHTPPSNQHQGSSASDKNICSAEKMTQTSDMGSSIWQVNLPQQNLSGNGLSNVFSDCSDIGLNDAMTCQELLAFSVAFSAALPTSQTTLETFYSSLSKPDSGYGHQPSQTIGTSTSSDRPIGAVSTASASSNAGNCFYEDFSCCVDLHQSAPVNQANLEKERRPRHKILQLIIWFFKLIGKMLSHIRRCVRLLVDQKYFQQGILLAILINTLSMGIEYHNQPEELTAIVETSNIVFSGIFAVEMLLKVIAEGPFKYIANGFNVFDGVIVILR